MSDQTPEQRAEALLRYMASLPDVPDVDTTLAVFARALREAEDAAYDRAADIAYDVDTDKAIRALKKRPRLRSTPSTGDKT